jgi:hypothetical protein
MMAKRFATIGVYGTTDASFFGALRSYGTTHFVDIRRRRGMRGALYAYVNSVALQAILAESGIEYRYEVALAPPEEVRNVQRHADEVSHTAMRERSALSPEFVSLYRATVLSSFDAPCFLASFPDGARVVLFCVEHEAAACHRSLVAADLGVDCPDITP